MIYVELSIIKSFLHGVARVKYSNIVIFL